jgi:hypothetical protein
VRSGCDAALVERQKWGGAPAARRDRWVTPGLIDTLHACVASTQGAEPWRADGAAPSELQPELRLCFESIEAFLDIDEPNRHVAPAAPAVAAACVDGQWAGARAFAVRRPDAELAHVMTTEELFFQLLETAVRR